MHYDKSKLGFTAVHVHCGYLSFQCMTITIKGMNDVITLLSERSAAHFDLQMWPSFWNDEDCTEAMVPQNPCPACQEQGFTCVSSVALSQCFQLHPTQRDENPGGSGTSLAPLPPRSVLSTGNISVSCEPCLARQQHRNSRLRRAQPGTSLHPQLWDHLPWLYLLCASQRGLEGGLLPAQTAVTQNSHSFGICTFLFPYEMQFNH